jgi:predicted DNA-binding transcriptional regulator AlpA
MVTFAKETAASPERRVTTDMIGWADLCREMRVSESTIRRWIRDADFPEPKHIGPRTLRFSIAEVREWLDRQYNSVACNESAAETT